MGQKNRSLALLFFYAALLRRSAAGEIYFWKSTAYQQTVDPVESRYDFEKQNIERIKKRSGHHEQDT